MCVVCGRVIVFRVNAVDGGAPRLASTTTGDGFLIFIIKVDPST